MSDFDDASVNTASAVRPSMLAWLREGLRSLFLLKARWQLLRTSPALMATLLLLDLALSLGFQRLYLNGPATFQLDGITSGWTGLVLFAWACYVLRPAAVHDEADPESASLLTLLLVQSLLLMLFSGVSNTILLKSNAADIIGDAGLFVIWSIPLAWSSVAALVALLRIPRRKAVQRLGATLAIGLGALIHISTTPVAFWIQATPEATEQREEPLRFTQEVVEEQAPLLESQLELLKPQRPGVIDMYTLTFAPFEGEEVFRRETRMVSDVMSKRFDAVGRNIQMLNHREHLMNMPWATTTNLERAIAGIAQTMDRDEDVLFIHLSSHGASDGELATNFWPLDVEPVMPENLRQWLDDAGIRHRVVSISACYAGNWVAPLANDDTLVMTASDATHTSYGCGKKSPLTFFGRAMYDEQIRSTTLSFEDAHAAARKVIKQREIDAGKTDGYSNPQIKVGKRIGPYLQKMQEQLNTR